MSKFQKVSVFFCVIFIGLALILIFINSLIMIDITIKNMFMLVLTFFIVISGILGCFIINCNCRKTKKIIILLGMALIIRIFWIVNINSIPISDFNTMYISAKELLSKNVSSFRGYGYLSRFRLMKRRKILE